MGASALREAATTGLRREGFAVITADDGMEAASEGLRKPSGSCPGLGPASGSGRGQVVPVPEIPPFHPWNSRGADYPGQQQEPSVQV
jgi:hypothetical protein